MSTVLILFPTHGAPRHFPITKPRTTIGRGQDCDLRIPLPSVSRHHCQIVIEDGTAWVRDADSRNGTFVNDVRVREAPLDPDDRLGIGPVVFNVASLAGRANAKPAPVK